MQPHEPVRFTTRDRVLRAWQNSMEAVRDYQLYANEIKDPAISDLFSRCAEAEGYQASKLRQALLAMTEQDTP